MKSAARMPRENRSATRGLRRVVPLIGSHIREYPFHTVSAFVCLILTRLMNLGVPIVMKLVVDDLSPRVAMVSSPVLLLLLFGSLRSMSAVAEELHDYIYTKVAARLKRKMTLDVFRHMHDLSLRFHLNRQVGGVVRDIERGADGLVQWMRGALFSFIPLLFEFSIIGAVLLWRFDWRFAAIAYGSVIAYIGFMIPISRRRTRMRRQTNDAFAAANSRALDSLMNFETVKACGRHHSEVRRYDGLLEKCENAAVRELSTLNLLWVGHGMIIATAMTSVLLLLVHGMRNGSFTVGDVVLINGLLFQLYAPLQQLGALYSSLSQSRVDVERMFALLDTRPDVVDAEDAVPLPAGPAAVAFRAVHLHYDATRPILRDISFEIAPGQTVALVGHSGSGKSTIARLLLRFFDATGGCVLVNGMDVRRVRQASLRAAMGCVLQESVLFNDTLRFNIGYGTDGASEHAIAAAARAAGIHDFIIGLPEGYATVVGERGLKLSTGEKQRVALARALLRDPRILILDEATSALDSESERRIQQEIGRLRGGRAALVIAHRLSTIVDADQILVLKQGRIVERGRHRELLRLDGHYARLWELQNVQQMDCAPLTGTESSYAAGSQGAI